MKKFFLLVLLLSVYIFAKNFNYSDIHKMPKSIEKDYYIWRLLNQKNTTKDIALKIIKDVHYLSPKIKKSYKKKTGKTISKKRKITKKLSAKALAKLRSRQKHASGIIKGQNAFKDWIEEKNREKLWIFNNSGKSGRVKLNHKIDKNLWKDLTTHNDINRFINKIKKEKLYKLKQAFKFAPAPKNKLNYNNLMYLGFYSIDSNQNNTASIYFSQASKKAYHREDVDRANFWHYLASRNKSILHKITKSYDINIYTLLAYDILKLKYPKTITPNLPKAKLPSIKQISNPMHWVRLKKEIKRKKGKLGSLADKYKSADTVGFYSYIKAKQSKEVTQYFPMPYRKLLKKLPKSRQAILYAIARQESRFIPTSISSSYALGMMQIMPFLIDHLAKQRKEKIDYDDMFNPQTSLIYANEHMNYLTKWLQHPLYIAYAYNAGIGYTRRMLRKKKFFRSNKSYKPYLSIELLDNKQANRYGKHVLSNYTIYMNKLGINLRISDLINTLHIPKKTDKFRK